MLKYMRTVAFGGTQSLLGCSDGRITATFAWLDGFKRKGVPGARIPRWLSARLAIERLRVRILAGVAGEFSSLQSTSCASSLFRVRSTPVLPQWHVKDPGHSANSAGGRLHLNTHTPLTQQSRSGLTMALSRHSVGTYQETSSHATRQGTLGHSSLSSLSHCGLILAYRVELVCVS